MKFEDCKFKLTFRSACLFEQMTGRSYFTLTADPDDIMKLTYCIIIANNENMSMTYSTFKILMGDKKVAKWVTEQYENEAAIKDMLVGIPDTEENENNDTNGEDDTKPVTMTDVVASLVMQYHLDPNYVMDRMQLWEIKPYFKCAENLKKAEMVEKRFWTYLTVMPHIDTKKCKSPEKLVPFAWEAKERNTAAMKDLKNNMKGIKTLIGQKFDWIK